MIIEIDRSFEKDFKKIKDRGLQHKIGEILDEIEKASSIFEVKNMKKMKWFHNFYRIRLGSYRIWVRLEWNKIICLRFRSREDIYNIFP